MLALTFSLLIAVYLLGPDLVARWILGFAAPRKVVVQSRAEELTRAILWAVGPLLVALFWAHLSHTLQAASWADVRRVYSGLYSAADFERSEPSWYASLQALTWWNLHLLWRLYLLAGLASVLIDVVIWRYGAIRRTLPYQLMKSLLAVMILPRIAEWHVLLSPMLLPFRQLQLHADVLTKNGTLYQGRVTDKLLNADGSLQNLTLAEPKRFLRETYRADQDAGDAKAKTAYWHSIPGNLFIVLGSDISNLNIRYVSKDKPGVAAQQFMRDLLRAQASAARAVKAATEALKEAE